MSLYRDSLKQAMEPPAPPPREDQAELNIHDVKAGTGTLSVLAYLHADTGVYSVPIYICIYKQICIYTYRYTYTYKYTRAV